MSSGYWANVRKIANGTPVDSDTTNKPIDDLEQRDEYLKSLIDALHLGECVYAWSVALDPLAVVGMVVYYDPIIKMYSPAQVGATVGGNTLLDSSLAVGVVTRRRTATVGDLILYGRVPLEDTTYIADPTVTGLRYVSASRPGTAESTAPLIKLPIGMWNSEEKVLYFHPASAGGTLDGHTHHRFELTSAAAGVVTEDYLQPHQFTSVNTASPGWLPADDAVFGGLAPVGAKFGYNISRQPDLLAAFPPLPLDSAHVEVYLDGSGSARSWDDVVKVTADGIWWMRDDWGWAPWSMSPSVFTDDPPEITDPDTPVRPPPVELQFGHGYMGSDYPCPVRVILWFDRPKHYTEGGYVRSITAQDGTPYIITDCAGNPATSGDLLLGFDLGMAQEEDPTDPGTAISRIDGGTFFISPSVASLKSNSDAIRITGGKDNGNGTRSGALTVTFVDPGAASEIGASLFALEHAVQDSYQNLFYLGLPPAITSAIRGRADLPSRGVPDSFNVSLEIQLIATSAGTPPAVQASYRRMPLPTAGGVLSAPNNSSEVALPDIPAHGSVSRPNVYYTVESEQFAVKKGDTIYFTLRRAVDSYAGTLGVIRVKTVIWP